MKREAGSLLSSDQLRRHLQLVVITDAAAAGPRPLASVVESALRAGAPSVQLRDKGARPRDLLSMARELRALTRAFGALLILNDRLDVALAADADGVHLGPYDLPVASVRRAAPLPFLIGYSTDDPERAVDAARDGANYIGCGTVYPTLSKADAGSVIGIAGLRRVVDAVDIPVVGIGGISAASAAEVAATGAAGVAVIQAVMSAEDPGVATARLLEALQASARSG